MTRIYVGNLSYDASDEDVRGAFERYGKVVSAKVMTDASTGRSRGFGFVSMPSLDDADEAINRLNGSSLNGRRLVVNEARESSSAPTGSAPPRQENRWHLVTP